MWFSRSFHHASWINTRSLFLDDFFNDWFPMALIPLLLTIIRNKLQISRQELTRNFYIQDKKVFL